MNANHNDPDEAFEPDEYDLDMPEDRPPSKSMLKRASHELQELGKRLLAMPDSRLDDIGMEERLRDALADYKTTRSFEGKRRQLQFIGKVLRGVEVEPLREAVASFEAGHARDALSLHEAEAWRKRLLDDEKQALTEWMNEFPETDVPQLRALIRNARKDAAAAPENRNGRAYRELFQLIKKALVAAHEGGADDSDEAEHGDNFEDQDD
jgi:ribosome-associated protein